MLASRTKRFVVLVLGMTLALDCCGCARCVLTAPAVDPATGEVEECPPRFLSWAGPRRVLFRGRLLGRADGAAAEDENIDPSAFGGIPRSRFHPVPTRPVFGPLSEYDPPPPQIVPSPNLPLPMPPRDLNELPVMPPFPQFEGEPEEARAPRARPRIANNPLVPAPAVSR